MKYSLTSAGRRMLTVLLIAGSLCSAARAGDYAIIINKDNPANVDKSFVAKIYTGDVKAWKDGATIAPIDLPEDSPIRASFSNDVLGKTVGNVKALWAQLVFSGRALPPKQAASDDEVKKLVAANKNAIGYVKTSSVDDSVKAVIK